MWGSCVALTSSTERMPSAGSKVAPPPPARSSTKPSGHVKGLQVSNNKKKKVFKFSPAGTGVRQAGAS